MNQEVGLLVFSRPEQTVREFSCRFSRLAFFRKIIYQYILNTDPEQI